MTKLVKISLGILILTGVAAAHGRYEPIKTADFAARPESFDGRLVEVKADIIAISADSKSIELFDSENRITITVKLDQFEKSQRTALIQSPARRLLVSGRATVVGRRLVIDAHKVEVLPSVVAAK